MTRFVVAPGGGLRGRIRVPGDKSISHRALMFAAVAEGVTRIGGLLAGNDVLATLAALRAMGVRIERDGDTAVSVHGAGRQGLRPPADALDLGNSGTSMRLLCGLLAGRGIGATLTGDASLRGRPMRRVTDPLGAMGADIRTQADGTAPLEIAAVSGLRGIDYEMPVASAQVKSAVLLAGLSAAGRTCVTEPAVTRDHTERMLAHFGVRLSRDGGRVCVEGGQTLTGADLVVPGDLSSAAFFLVGASLAPGSDLVIENVGVNPTRTGVIDVLLAMGGDVEVLNRRDIGSEPVADLRVRHAPLHGIEIPPELVPLAIDELPAVLTAAACAEGETLLSGAEELRYKESDRIDATARALGALGVVAEPLPDGMRVVGGRPAGGRVHARGDHRIAMAFAMLALPASGEVVVEDCANVATSFPGFAALAAGAGLGIREARA